MPHENERSLEKKRSHAVLSLVSFGEMRPDDGGAFRRRSSVE